MFRMLSLCLSASGFWNQYRNSDEDRLKQGHVLGVHSSVVRLVSMCSGVDMVSVIGIRWTESSLHERTPTGVWHEVWDSLGTLLLYEIFWAITDHRKITIH